MIYYLGANDRAINKYFLAKDMDGALAYVEEHYNPALYSYYARKADIYSYFGEFDSGAESILEYCDKTDLAAIDNNAVQMLQYFQPKVSEGVAGRMDDILPGFQI